MSEAQIYFEPFTMPDGTQRRPVLERAGIALHSHLAWYKSESAVYNVDIGEQVDEKQAMGILINLVAEWLVKRKAAKSYGTCYRMGHEALIRLVHETLDAQAVQA